MPVLFAHHRETDSWDRDPVGFEFLRLLPGALTAADQFVALASSLLPRACHVSALPPSVLVECIGKRWVTAVDRPVLANFGLGAFAGYEVFFSVSHTLGLVQVPCRVIPNAGVLGWIAPDRCLMLPDIVYGSDHNNLVVGQIRDGEADIAQIQELVGWRDRLRRSARVACNRRWIAMSRKGSGSLMLWRVGDGVASEDHLECSVAKKLLQLRFFTTTSAYDSESDTLELSFLEDDLVFATSIVIHHVDLRKVWQEGVITMDSVSVISDCCLSAQLSSGLCSPLLDRDKVVYYLPVTKVCSTEPRKKVPGSLSRSTLGQLSFKAPARAIEKHYLLDLNTGEPIAWLKTPAGQLEVKAVDESHLATTTSDHSSTSVFALSSLTRPNKQGAPETPFRKGAHSRRCPPRPTPLCTYRHPPGTQKVTSGCGLLVTSTTVQSPPISDDARRVAIHYHHPSSSRRFGLPYDTATPLSSHTFTDAVSGATLFTITLPMGVLLLSIVPITFRTPKVVTSRAW
ncbi:hypothetical protein Pelo_2384 [Pelomyxa schiedti]|nr:hypothetical protein Pelo_2384 [Pelomyxa schiedti]